MPRIWEAITSCERSVDGFGIVEERYDFFFSRLINAE